MQILQNSPLVSSLLDFFILLILSSLNSSTSKWIFSKTVRLIPINPMADSLLGTQLINHIFFSESQKGSLLLTHTCTYGVLCTHSHIYTFMSADREVTYPARLYHDHGWNTCFCLDPSHFLYLHPFTFRSKQTSWGQPSTGQLGDKFSIMLPF